MPHGSKISHGSTARHGLSNAHGYVGLHGTPVTEDDQFETPLPPPLTYPVITKVVTEGDSITSSGGGYMATAIAANPGVTFTNVAVAGSGMGGPADDSSGNSTVWGRIHLVVAAAPQLVTILIGANGVFPMSDLTSYITALKTRLPGVLVAVSTILPATTHGASRETLRLARNAEIRAALGTSIDAVIPMGDHPVASLYTNGATYFPDGLHPAPIAHTAYAPQYDAVVSGIIARLNDNTPDVFTFTDTNNVPVSTDATALTLVKGMGRQATATASITGAGDFANGLGAYSTAAKTVINGDVLINRVTASATPSTPLDQVLTIGGVTDTWTVTSAAPANAAFYGAATYKTARNLNIYGNGTRNVTDVEMPAGRPVIAMYYSYGDPTALNIGGVAMTKIVASGGWTMWIGASDLTAGTYTLAVTGGNHIDYDIFSGALTGITSSTPGGVSKSAMQYRNPWELVAGDVSLTVGTGGLGVIFCPHPTQTLNNLYGSTVGQGYSGNYHWLTRTTTGVPQVDFTGGTASNGLIAAAWP